MLRTANTLPLRNILITLRNNIVGPAEEVFERRMRSFAHDDGRHSPEYWYCAVLYYVYPLEHEA